LAAVYAVGKKTKIFHFGPSFKETPVSEADVTLAWIEIYGLIATKATASRKARRMLFS
jgi:hypothetical protein